MTALIRDIRQRLGQFSEVTEWPELVALIDRPTHSERPCWGFTLDACQAVGGQRAAAWPGAGVVFSLLYSIHLVDDLLDEDPKGVYHRLGEGAAANMALAFQSLASKILGQCSLDAEAETEAHRRLGEACLGTAFGQMLDSCDFEGEEAYWRMVKLKTPPLFSFALFLGALIGGAGLAASREVGDLGGILGEIIQISDDLHDALEKPAAPDWLRKSTNLPILYASTADHPEKQAFLDLLPSISDGEALEAAQEILVRSGAFSFCAYRLIQAYRRARREIEDLSLADPAALIDLFEHHVRPLKKLLSSVGVEAPEDFFEGGDA